MTGRYDNSSRIYIAERPIYFAWCVYCSYQGPEHDRKADAERDMDAHVGTGAHHKAVRQ